MKFIDAAAVNAALTFPDLVAALEAAHRQDVDALEDMLIQMPQDEGAPQIFFNRAAWQNGKSLGMKLVTLFPENERSGSGFPNIQALYVLFGGQHGEVLGAIDGTSLTYWKTAADSALGAKFLAREDAKSLLMVGAGAMAKPLIRAHLAVRPAISRLSLWNRTRANGHRLAEELQAEGVTVSLADDLEAAVRGADVISCATMSPEPLIKGAWLKPGAHLDLVGAFTLIMREADDEALRRASVFVDARATAVKDTGEIAIPLAAGVIRETDIRADFFDLCRGAPGRQSAEEITFFKNAGGGHLDLMTAQFIVQQVG